MSCGDRGDKKNPPNKKNFDPFEHLDEKSKKESKCEANRLPKSEPSKKESKCEANRLPKSEPSKKVDTSKSTEKDSKKDSKVAPPTCQKQKPDGSSLKIKLPSGLTDKIKLPGGLKDKIKIPPDLINNIKNKIPAINVKTLKNIDYGKWLKYGYSKINIWVRENCNPKKMADKGSGAPSRPMKFPYTFSAKIAQFPMGFYVKNQWIWKYYVVAFAACMPIFYSINKLANSPGNVAKWAEIRRKEAAEHHH